MALSRYIDKITAFVGRWDGYIVVPMFFLIAYATCKRYFFNEMPGWGYDVPIFLYGIHFMLGGAWTMQGEKHVNVDIINKFIPEKWRKHLATFSDIIVLTSCLFIVFHGTGWAWESTLINEKSVQQTLFNPSIWWFKWLVPISFLLVALQALSNIAKRTTRKHNEEEA